jgi:DNA repair protein RadC
MKDVLKTRYVPLVRLQTVKERDVPYGINGKVDTPSKVANLVGNLLKDSDREQLIVLSVDTKTKPVCIEYIAVGALNVVHVEPREIFKHAILSNASAIIMVHNHPSGEVEPSENDFKITKRIMKAGKLIGIELLDHIIIGDNETFFNLKDTDEWEEMKNGSKC